MSSKRNSLHKLWQDKFRGDEEIVREGFKQTKGQFFTHINIVKFLLWGLQLDKLAIERVNKDLEIPYKHLQINF